MISSLLYNLNHAQVWQRDVQVWNHRVRAASLDRLLCLGLHRAGWMGRDEAALFRKLIRPGMKIVDVGANAGLYSLLFARLTGESGHVFSFEPEPNLFRTLRDNCAANDVDNITTFECALGSAAGSAWFQRSALNSGDNRLGTASPAHESVRVEVARFADLLPEVAPDFVKIDVQGHELGALRGMGEALERNCSVQVFFEFSPAALRLAGTEPEQLLQFFRARGFSLFATDHGALRKVTEEGALLANLRGRRYTNLLASRTDPEVK